MATYGATVGGLLNNNEDLEAKSKFQTFSIAEPYAQLTDETDPSGGEAEKGPRTPLRHNAGAGRPCCCCWGRDMDQSLRLIVLSMFIFAAGVTVALFIQIATGLEPIPHDADHTASDHEFCTKIGDEVMDSGGNAVDAAVAATFCLAVVNPHMTGIGGGGTMLIHKHRENKTTVIDFREVAPESADNERYIENPNIARFGQRSIGIPGFVKGLDLAHKKYGSGHFCCSWGNLIWKSITLSSLIGASQHLVNATQSRLSNEEIESPTAVNLKQMLYQDGIPVSGDTMLNDIPMFKELIKNLETLALKGAESFYQGEIADHIVTELKGIISKEDLSSYEAIEREAISVTSGDYQILASPAPTSGPKLLAFINAITELQRIEGVPKIDENYISKISRILERAEKLQQGLGDPTNSSKVQNQMTAMIDPELSARLLSEVRGEEFGFDYDNVQSPVGAHVAVMDKNDMYVSVISSLNTWFGSKFMSSNGILFNNAMSGFAIPSSVNGGDFSTENTLSAMRRPLTNGVVAVALNVEKICGQRLVLGGSTADSVGEVLADTIVFQHDFKSSVDQARVQVVSDSLVVEGAFQGVDRRILDQLQKTGNNYTFALLPYTTVNGVDKIVDNVLPYEDPRSGGHLNGEIQTTSRLQQ